MAVSITRLAFPTETLKALLPQIVTSVLRGRDGVGHHKGGKKCRLFMNKS